MPDLRPPGAWTPNRFDEAVWLLMLGTHAGRLGLALEHPASALLSAVLLVSRLPVRRRAQDRIDLVPALPPAMNKRDAARPLTPRGALLRRSDFGVMWIR